MGKFSEFVKKKWQVVVIVLLALLFVSKCNSSNNFERKYKKETKRVEYVTDSLTNMYSNGAKVIDSLKYEIRLRDREIKNLEGNIKRLEKITSDLNDRLKDVANKKVNVNIENKTIQEEHKSNSSNKK